MPRPAVQANVTPGQASYVLEKLRKAGRVTAAQISGYLKDMAHEIRALEERLLHLRTAAGSPETQAAAREGGEIPTPFSKRTPARPTGRKRTPAAKEAGNGKAAAKARKRKFTVTPKVLASRELQGRYLPLLNKFTGEAKANYARLAKEKGREAAIAEMEAALKDGGATGTPPAPQRRRQAPRRGRAAKR